MTACVWCRESLPVLARVTACPTCERPLVDKSGAALRKIDLDFESILTAADASTLKWTKRGAIFAFAVAAIGIVPLFAPVALLVLILAQFFWARFLIARPYARHYSPIRRMVTRWIGRLALVLFVAGWHGSVFIPGLALVLSPAVFAGSCWVSRAYHRFHFLREHRREPILVIEMVFLAALAVLFLLALAVVGLVVWGLVSFLPSGATK